MIVGIGTDIVEIDRISKIIKRTPNFISRVFTDKEISYFGSKNNNAESIAGCFAAKEAVSKALGTGIRGFALKDIEVDHDRLGKPYVKLSERLLAKNIVENISISLSISHSKNNAIAFAVIEEV